MLEKHRKLGTAHSEAILQQLGEVTPKRLAQIHYQFKIQFTEYYRAKSRMKKHLQECYKLEDIVENYSNPERIIDSPFWPKYEGKRCGKFRDNWSWFWNTRLAPVLSRTLSIVFACLSVLIFLCEVTLFTSFPLGVIPIFFYEDYGEIVT
jgi:hypothetical protein